MKIKYRIMDTDNSGIEWGEYTTAEIPDPVGETEDEISSSMAKNIARHNWMTMIEQDEEAPGDLVRSRGDDSSGIAWFDDLGHQGATCIIIEWHAIEED